MRIGRYLLRGWALLAYLFLFSPILMVVLMSFSKSKYSVFPIRGWTTDWYGRAFGDQKIIDALQTSVGIAVVSSILATFIGTLGAMALVRHQFKLRELARAYFLSPLIIPEIITGIALLSMATLLNLQSGIVLVVIGHVLFGLPFVVTVVSARLYGFDRSLEEAAMDLGADEVTTFRRITLPMMTPAILGGLLLSFTVSFDNFLITYLLAGSEVMTIPVHIYSMIRFEFTPKIHAISTVIVVVSLTLILLSQTQTGDKRAAAH
ncbi:MAG: ABC transporter permease [Chromatiales bacterium]|nr:ABC transporter permease [Chromatiales bacterium]